MSQNLDTYQTISLAGGASTTIAHGILDNSGGLIPNIVLPDRSTPIAVVGTPTTTQITFTNPNADAQTAKFWIQRNFSMQEDDNRSIYWRGSNGGSAAAQQQLENVFFVDSTLAEDATVRRYATVDTALIAATAALGASAAVELVFRAGSYTWTGTNIGDRDVVFTGQGHTNAGLTTLDLFGATIDGTASPTQKYAVFQNFYVTTAADFDGNRVGIFRNCYLDSVQFGAATGGYISFDDCQFVDLQVLATTGGDDISLEFINCAGSFTEIAVSTSGSVFLIVQNSELNFGKTTNGAVTAIEGNNASSCYFGSMHSQFTQLVAASVYTFVDLDTTGTVAYAGGCQLDFTDAGTYDLGDATTVTTGSACVYRGPTGGLGTHVVNNVPAGFWVQDGAGAIIVQV